MGRYYYYITCDGSIFEFITQEKRDKYMNRIPDKNDVWDYGSYYGTPVNLCE